MLADLMPVLKHSLAITGFVFVMMLLIEYVNVQTNGAWQNRLSRSRWGQYVLAGILGAIPGCLGAFTTSTLFTHRIISFGAIVTAMIATSGDEAFILFAMIPEKAMLLTVLLFIIAILAGYLTDMFYPSKNIHDHFREKKLPLHDDSECHCFNRDQIIPQLLKPSLSRFTLIVLLILFLYMVFFGSIAGESVYWIKYTLIFTISFSLFVVVTVPEHFLEKHLWEHILKMHMPRIFLWTFGTLLVISVLMNYVGVHSWLSEHQLLILLTAILIGIIPESGPHMVFVTLFAQGSIPFSVLLASSIAQDGHGMLPLLAESKKSFLKVKLVNIIIAAIAGVTGLLTGF